MTGLSRYRPRPSLEIVTPVQCVPTGHPNRDETTRLHVSRPYFRNRFQGSLLWISNLVDPVRHLHAPNIRPRGQDGFVAHSSGSRHHQLGSRSDRTCRKRPGSGTLLEHLSRVAPALHYPCSVAPAGMSRPLLEFGGGSGEILRDLLHLRSVSEAEALISCAEGRDQLRHISQPRLTCRPFRLISGLERTGGQRRLQEPSALERGRSGPRRQRGRFRGRGPGPPTPGIAQLSLLPACCQSAPVPAASGSRGTADSGPGCAAGSKRTTRARLAARGAA